jgi:hypothetical protein
MALSKPRVTFFKTPYATGHVGTGALIVVQHPECQGAFDENGIAREHVCGRMYLDELDDAVKVSGVRVDGYAQRGRLGFKIGTTLYETAGRLACKVARKPLVSDWRRSPMAEGFWKKQVGKGRAVYDDAHQRYVLTCPVTTLGRRR